MTDEELVAAYESGARVDDLVTLTGIKKRTLYNRMYRAGVTMRSRNDRRVYGYRTDRFQSIETPEDAYWLGMLCADGWVTSNLEQFGLSQNDRNLLERFCDYMGAEYSYIKEYTHRNGGLTVTLGMHIYPPRLVALGCTPQKSKTLQPPPITDNPLIHAYLKGYFEGDGFASVNDKGYVRMGIASGSYEWIAWARDQIVSVIDKKYTITTNNNHWGNVYVLPTYGKKAEKLLTYWRDLPTPTMDRKYPLKTL